jgi:hypothetical protein
MLGAGCSSESMLYSHFDSSITIEMRIRLKSFKLRDLLSIQFPNFSLTSHVVN